MTSNKTFLALVALFASIVLMPTPAAALFPTQNNLLGITGAPELPVPGENITLTAHQAGGSAYTYVWTRDGAQIGAGVDRASVTVTAGGVGSRSEIAVTLLDASGAIAGSGTFFIRPAEVDLVWEGTTYVPPFYAGRPLANEESEVVAQAIPRLVENGAPLAAGSLRYAWELNGKSYPAGNGKSSVRVKQPSYGAPFTISVRVSNTNGSLAAVARATIVPTSARAIIFEDAPLSGIDFRHAVSGGVEFAREEMTFRAYPVFVSDPEELVYEWTLGGDPFVIDSSDPRTATFRKTSGGSGIFRVGFSFTNPRRLFEDATASFSLLLP